MKYIYVLTVLIFGNSSLADYSPYSLDCEYTVERNENVKVKTEEADPDLVSFPVNFEAKGKVSKKAFDTVIIGELNEFHGTEKALIKTAMKRLHVKSSQLFTISKFTLVLDQSASFIFYKFNGKSEENLGVVAFLTGYESSMVTCD